MPMVKKAVVSTPAKRKMEQTQPQPLESPSRRSYKIGGISVDFPYKPYGSQLAYMAKVISALERAHRHRHGHCHALLESPTGSGKSLALLCATLAWQHQYKTRVASCPPCPVPNTPAQTPIPPTGTQRENALAVGGGFIPEDSQSGVELPLGESQQAAPVVGNGAEKKPKVPTIFYASRTHSQISQVIREYRKTAYRVPMAVLASRKHYCTNKRVCSKKNVDEECKLLVKDSEQSCLQFKNAYKVKYHPSVRKGGCNEVHDIEDLVKVGHLVKGCSYFAARDMALEAQLVFCPYSYILNPIIRRAMEVNIEGNIVILDEAHNIEDLSREAGSLDVEEKVLDVLQTELGQLSLTDSVASIYQPLLDMIQGLIQWIRQKSNNLEKREFEQYCSCWTGDKALRELQAAGISQDYFPILQECAIKAIKAASETEKDGFYLSGLSASTLEGLFSSLTYFFSENAHRASEYQLGVQRYVKRDEGMAAQGWTHSFSLWCLNPAVVFKEIAEASASVILTSGTLSPMNSFASELGVQFEICMEAPHVINLDSQVWAAAVAAGPGNVSLNASYKTADGYAFQDALGGALEEICKIVPDGVLVFFPSYKLMEKLCNRWKATGQWTRLNEQKSLFVEPRGSQDNFEAILGGYYSAIRGEKKKVVRKLKDGRKQVPNPGSCKEGLVMRSKGGAAFLAVCRGKVSEGIDFSDENARAVVVVGIPFPNKKDIQVELKKRYNNIYKSSKNLLSGDQWYCHQAFRALNQAVGRCIRHRLDFGAIILLDERFKKSGNLEYMSKWMRNSIRQFDNFEQSLQGLHNFFIKVEDQKAEFDAEISNLITRTCVIDDSDTVTCKENISASKMNATNKGVTKKANRKMQDFYRQIDQENNITQEVTSASQSMTKNDPSGDFKMDTNRDMSTSTLNIINGIQNKPAIQRKVDASFNAEDHADSAQNIHTYSKYFARSPLRETSDIQGSVLTDNRENTSTKIDSSSASLLSHAEIEIGHHCSDQNLCDIETPARTVVAIESGQLSHGSPDLGNNSGGFFGSESLNPLNSTPVRGSENSLFSKHYLSNSVGMSGNSLCRKRRSPIRIQSDDDMKTMLFVQPTERNDLDQQCKTECSTTPENKMVQCQKLGNACLEESVPISICNQSVCKLVPNSTTRSSVIEGVNGSGNRYGVLLQSQSMESSMLQAQNLQSDTSTCLLEHHSESTSSHNTNTTEKICLVSCSYCGNSFGLPEKQFLVSCIVTSLSKSHFNILENRNQECLPIGDNIQDRTARTPVIISDIKCLNQHFSRTDPSQGSLTSSKADNQKKSKWVEEDGCVFRALFCPQCQASNACVGVHVMATDVSNISLLDKVVFFRNHVKVVDAELVAQREVHEHGIKSDTSKGLNISSIEDYSYGFNIKRPRCMSVSKTKLRLPKKE